MAWTDVRIIKDSFADALRSTTAERVYYAEADGPVDADLALAASFGGVSVPAKGEAFSLTRLYCRAISRRVERLSPTQFNVTVNFEDPTDGTVEEEADLLTQAAKITQQSSNTMEQYTVDADDVQVRNSAGEPFDTFPERLSSGVVYTIRKYVNAATKVLIEAAERTTNAGAKTILNRAHAADTLLLAGVTFEAEGTLFLATMTIEYLPEGWADIVLDVGFREKVGGVWQAIKLPDGSAIARAWPLNADGTKKTNADDAADAITFYPYEQHAWTGVPLS